MFLCLMRQMILVFLFATLSVSAQKKVNKTPVNDLELNTPMSQYEVLLISGDEEIYAKYPELRKNVVKNISDGIREGLYAGYTFNKIEKFQASRTTLFFYEEELFKVRWFFQKKEFPNLEEVSEQLTAYLEERYGEGKEEIPGLLKSWKGRKRYLQYFSDENELQIEYRDEKIQKKVDKLE